MPVDTQEELLAKVNDATLLFYKGKRLLHTSIIKEYKDDMDLNLLIKRATSRQTMIFTESTQIQPLITMEALEEFLIKNSKTCTQILSIYKLAQGGEAIVYGVDHTGSDEIVVKCPLLGEKLDNLALNKIYDSIFYES